MASRVHDIASSDNRSSSVLQMPLPCSTSCRRGMVPTARGDEGFPQVILGAEVPLNEEIVKALREEGKQLIILWLRHGMPWIYITMVLQPFLILKRYIVSFPVFSWC